MRNRVILFLTLLLGTLGGVHAAETQVELVLSHAAARPGDTVHGALRFKMNPGWHIYWRNPGDAGFPPSVEWELPKGVTVSDFQWPAPEKMVIAQLAAYVYEGEVLLPFTVSISSDAAAGTVALKGPVNWLECSDKACVPADGMANGQLAVGSESRSSQHADLIASWLERIPKQAETEVSASWEGPATGETRNVVIEWDPAASPDEPDFFPYESEDFTIDPKTEVVAAGAERVRLRKTVTSSDGKWPEQISGLILDSTKGEKHEAFVASPKVSGASAAAAQQRPTEGTGAGFIQLDGDKEAPKSLLAILALAFVGGLILNIMPCVLPVIALKILGFVNQSRDEPKRVRQLGLLYGLGVVASFLVLAGVVIAVKNAGSDAVWGMQMQNPIFVLALTVLLAFVTLNLFGVFEITLSGRVMEGATAAASREGKSGAFYNGVLATLLATPCTAPALAVAVGAALAQPSAIIVLTFATVAIGMAAPYVLLCWNPRWMKFLPKPGAWMERFKIAMGFPMLATTVWLLSVAASHYGRGSVLWLGLFLVLFAAAAWTWGQFVQRGSRRSGLAIGVAAAFLLIGYFWILEGKLRWREEIRADSGAGGEAVHGRSGFPWASWSSEAVEEARRQGHPVLVDFTADWCLTCQVNKGSIETDAVEAKLKEIGGVALIADFTSRSKVIAQELKRFNRAGVPLVVVFPADPNAPAIVLPEFLTPGIVLEALDRAAKSKAVSRLASTP